MNRPQYGMQCLYNHEIPMRDGVILRGDLFRPAEVGRCPVLLLRTIFRKETMGRTFGPYDPAWYVRHGYAVYIQDARGLGESDGAFDRFTADGPDGYDTIEYLAAQPWCNGRVGMMGSYFAGYLQLMAAAERPPHLRAIAPLQTSVSINRDCDTRGFMFFSHIGWCMSRLCNRLADGRYDEQTTAEWLPKLRAWLKDYPRSQLSVWPARSMPVLKDSPFPLIHDYFHHLVEGYDDFDLLHKEGRDMDVRTVATPAFYVAGWYDSSRTPLIDHCMAQRGAGVDSRVLVAPWHPGDAMARADSALESGVTAVDVQRELIAWFDHWLKDGPLPQGAPVRYYDVRSDLLYEGETWPPAHTRELTLYVNAGRTLGAAPAQMQGSDSYHHDPKNPLGYRGYGAGAVHPEDNRVLNYVSEPLAEELNLCGLPRATVCLSSTARDADIMLSLCDVAPDGSVFTICDGATRARYRNGWTPEPLMDESPVRMEVLLGNVCCRVPKGHRLMLQASGSAFPKYDVNHGTAERPADDADWVESEQHIWYGGETPTALHLPHL